MSSDFFKTSTEIYWTHTFFFVGRAVKEVDVGGGDLQATFDDLHDRDEFTFFLQDELLLLLPNFLLLLGKTTQKI